MKCRGSGNILRGAERNLRIKNRMTVLKITKAELGRRIKVKPPAVTTMFRRDSWRFPDTYNRVAAALDVDVAYLLWRPARMDGGFSGSGKR